MLDGLNGYRFRHLLCDAATPATISNALDKTVHDINFPTLEPDIKAREADKSVPIRSLHAIRINYDYLADTEMCKLLNNVASAPAQSNNCNPSTTQDLLPRASHNECLTLEDRVCRPGD
jgi:hypothetical protein